jgi:hypothetical protein
MGYIGNQQTEGFSQVPAKQDLTGATGTSLTLSHAVASAEGIDLFINNVRQESGEAYSIAGDGVTVTLTGSVVATDDIYVVYNSLALQTTVPPDASVSTAKIIDGSVTDAKLASGAVTAAKMPNGAVLQVKQTIGSTSVQNISSTSFASVGLSIDITPRDANSKFLIQGAMDIDVDANEQTFFTVFRDAANLGNTNGLVNAWNGTNRMIVPVTILILDSPSTASQITYEIKAKISPAISGAASRLNSQGNKIIMTVSEIAG